MPFEFDDVWDVQKFSVSGHGSNKKQFEKLESHTLDDLARFFETAMAITSRELEFALKYKDGDNKYGDLRSGFGLVGKQNKVDENSKFLPQNIANLITSIVDVELAVRMALKHRAERGALMGSGEERSGGHYYNEDGTSESDGFYSSEENDSSESGSGESEHGRGSTLARQPRFASAFQSSQHFTLRDGQKQQNQNGNTFFGLIVHAERDRVRHALRASEREIERSRYLQKREREILARGFEFVLKSDVRAKKIDSRRHRRYSDSDPSNSSSSEDERESPRGRGRGREVLSSLVRHVTVSSYLIAYCFFQHENHI
jgi:hypothetical protein